jgi:hypothetical protein
MRARGGHSHTPAPAPAPQIPAAGHIDSITRMEIIRITCFLITKHEVSKFARGRAFVLSRRFKVRTRQSQTRRPSLSFAPTHHPMASAPHQAVMLQYLKMALQSGHGAAAAGLPLFEAAGINSIGSLTSFRPSFLRASGTSPTTRPSSRSWSRPCAERRQRSRAPPGRQS